MHDFPGERARACWSLLRRDRCDLRVIMGASGQVQGEHELDSHHRRVVVATPAAFRANCPTALWGSSPFHCSRLHRRASKRCRCATTPARARKAGRLVVCIQVQRLSVSGLRYENRIACVSVRQEAEADQVQIRLQPAVRLCEQRGSETDQGERLRRRFGQGPARCHVRQRLQRLAEQKRTVVYSRTRQLRSLTTSLSADIRKPVILASTLVRWPACRYFLTVWSLPASASASCRGSQRPRESGCQTPRSIF